MAQGGNDYLSQSQRDLYAAVPQTDSTAGRGDSRAGPDDTYNPGLTAENARLAAAALFSILGHANPIKVETSSVYGPGIVMPQIARSTGYNRRVTELAMRSLIFVGVNFFVQGWILYMFSKELYVMDRFAGRMSLCDFGAYTEDCPNSPGCVGPAGTPYAAHRLYPYAQWNPRTFFRDSLRELFDNKDKTIGTIVDPGEYGVESSLCRSICCFLFMMAVTKDAFQIYELWRLLYSVPSWAEPWILYDENQKPECVETRTLSIDRVRLKIAGMPTPWKYFNGFCIMLPKTMFWLMTADLGITFLMNTSGITDSIVNSMALAFILSIDELIFDTATASRTKYMMNCLEPFHPNKQGETAASTQSVMEEEEIHQRSLWCPDFFPRRLIFVMVMTWACVVKYYFMRCQKADDGTWVSKPLYMPKSLDYSWLTAYFPFLFPLDVEDEPAWTPQS